MQKLTEEQHKKKLLAILLLCVPAVSLLSGGLADSGKETGGGARAARFDRPAVSAVQMEKTGLRRD